jgi:hypothetical protein
MLVLADGLVGALKAAEVCDVFVDRGVDRDVSSWR